MEDEKPKEIKIIKKNYQDATNGVLYSLGCSLIHLTLFVTHLTITTADPSKAREYDLKFQDKLALVNDVPIDPDFC